MFLLTNTTDDIYFFNQLLFRYTYQQSLVGIPVFISSSSHGNVWSSTAELYRTHDYFSRSQLVTWG